MTNTPTIDSRVGDERLDAETLERKLHLWFFRDLTGEQRLGLFKLCGYPVGEMQTHSVQQMCLRHLTAALSRRSLDDGVEPVVQCATEGCVNAGTERLEAGGVGSDYCQPCFDQIKTLTSPAQETVTDATLDLLRRARLMTGVMEGLTGCRGDDEWVWALQADLDAALSSKGA